MRPRLLVSPVNRDEALEAVEGGAHIIDVKNPEEGSLGANFPWVIREIMEVVPEDREVSATVGDVPYKPGTVAQAVLGVAAVGVDYAKVGLYGTKTEEEALEVMRACSRAVREFGYDTRVVAAGYADAHRVDSIDPMSVPEVAAEAECDVAMVDTAVKDGKRLFDFLREEEVGEFVDLAHEHGLEVALAGSLRHEDMPIVRDLGADIVGIRGAACERGDRNRGAIRSHLVRKLAEALA
ncbi:(5-formylfuran-3-yl)methyl phosphate synthase [Methanopyrus sp. KOL6]|uniref:(5-formylfuran-3-yl)methyl phosphate synthase n=1 Tax=Methanopyrus sp. KOL6 TaxID=1937004 RepID=UPI000B4A9AC8|nr:(5-formylfuran-3-yl)methyl phosphate synthase [Methanopyrus sp. KOL6]